MKTVWVVQSSHLVKTAIAVAITGIGGIHLDGGDGEYILTWATNCNFQVPKVQDAPALTTLE